MRNSIVIWLLALGFVAANAAAVPPTIHVTWGEPGEPQEPGDYEIDATDPDFPNIKLITGSLTWQIWSTDTDNPNDLGDIGTISSPFAEDFGVKIEDDQGGPGARRVIGGIHLIPTDLANYSNITGGEIPQNIGGITLQRSESNVGGVVDNLVVGDVIGDVNIPVLTSLDMAGLKGGDLTVTDFVSAPGLVLGGQVFNDISIADIHSGGQVLLTSSELTFFGNLDLLNGVPSGAVVRISLDLMGTTIDLNNKDVAGRLECLGNSSASIVNGGNVGGTVVLAGGSGNTYLGTATFISLSASSEAPAPEIKTVDGADLSGTIDITGVLTGVTTGKIIVDGALVGTGLINVEANFEGDIEIGEGTSAQSQITLPTALDNGATIQINTSQGDFNAGGSIEIGVPSPTFVPIPIVFDGCIRIFDELGTGDGGDLTGSIEVCGCHATADDLNICIDGNDNGNVTITQTGCTNQVDYSCDGCP